MKIHGNKLKFLADGIQVERKNTDDGKHWHTHTVVYADMYEYAPNVSTASNELVTFRMLFLCCQMQGYVYNVEYDVSFHFYFYFSSIKLANTNLFLYSATTSFQLFCAYVYI